MELGRGKDIRLRIEFKEHHLLALQGENLLSLNETSLEDSGISIDHLLDLEELDMTGDNNVPSLARHHKANINWSYQSSYDLDIFLPLEIQHHLERLTGCEIERNDLLHVVNIRGPTKEVCRQLLGKIQSDLACFVCTPSFS